MKKLSITVSYFCVSAIYVIHHFSLRDVQALGVNLLGHQRKIVNAAKQLRTHLTQGHVEVWCFPNCVDTAGHAGRSSPQPAAGHMNTGIEMRITKRALSGKEDFYDELFAHQSHPFLLNCCLPYSRTPSFGVALPLTFLSVHYLLAFSMNLSLKNTKRKLLHNQLQGQSETLNEQ